MTFNNDFFFFEKDKKYQLNVKYSKLEEFEYLFYYFELKINLDYFFEELSFGARNYSKIDYTFYKICYKNTPKIIFETKQTQTRFLISFISESYYNIFLRKYKSLNLKK